jgi:rubredoxin
MQFIGRFGFKSGRDSEKLEGINYKFGQTRSPIVLDHATSYMDCELVTSMDAGTHTIFLGRVVDADVVSDGRPMTYEHYHRVKGGKSPKTAPTYAGPAEDEKPSKMEGKSMASYKCTICGYVYDPAEGAPDVGIAAGTAFEDLPDSWVCPICGASKTEFEKAG